MRELWDLFRDRDALMFVVAIIGSVTSSLVVAILWAKCWRSEEDEPDGGFIVGHTLSTLSCFGFMVSYLLTILSTAKEKSATGLIGLALVAGLLGVLILPFGHIRMKWLSLLACSLNVVLLVSVVYVYAE